MADLFEITGMSLKSAAKGTFKNPGPWLLIALMTAIICYIEGILTGTWTDYGISIGSAPGIILLIVAVLLTFIVAGPYVKTLLNKTPDFKNFGTTFKNGFLVTIIILIYWIVQLLLAAFLIYGVNTWGTALTDPLQSIIYAVGIGIAWVIVVLLLMLVMVVANPAGVLFARTGKFSSAFNFAKLSDMIQAVSWGKCVLGTILQTCVFAVLVAAILCIGLLVALIPVVGDIIAAIAMGLLIPFAIAFITYFCAHLFAEVKNE
ncbi:MAG TPA: DUF4013 domain-containing protein [Methanocorpusculum sp.]|nr:DUF4013 domain-containing protein [Methanocorpusculum sp.]